MITVQLIDDCFFLILKIKNEIWKCVKETPTQPKGQITAEGCITRYEKSII